jgi:two-component system nitrate/nitrite sensor histidine kinase NarX
MITAPLSDQLHYRRIFETTTDGMIIHSPDGQVVEANPAACAMLGYSHEAFLQLRPPDFIHPDSNPQFAEFLETVPTDRPFRCDAHLIRQDGSVFDVAVIGTRLMYGGSPHLLAILRDITEERRTHQMLEARVAERTRELTTLLEVSHNLTSTLDMQSLIHLILDQLKPVVDYWGASIMTVQDGRWQALAFRGPLPTTERLSMRFPVERGKLIFDAVQRREVVNIPDIHADAPLAADFRSLIGAAYHTTGGQVASWLCVPLIIKERVLGVLSLAHATPHFYDPHRQQFVVAFANQAAIAIENARLYEQARQLAAFEERQRLARDLHDVVTQTLFSACLVSEVLPRLWETDIHEGQARLAQLNQLTRSALAEMRTLLLELRPSGLVQARLCDLLRQLADASRSRTRANIIVDVPDTCSMAPDVQVAIYRIAQEALNNVIRHAGATEVNITLQCTRKRICLQVADNGRGFNPKKISASHMGLGIMRERSSSIGARFTLRTRRGQGTTIRVTWSATRQKKEQG